MYHQKRVDNNTVPFSEDGSVYTSQPPPDRSSSSSAPPALELSSESLFAFTLDYAKIFTDIRTHEDYNDFYESYENKDKKLPPPLEAHFLESLSLETDEEQPIIEPKRNNNFTAPHQAHPPQNPVMGIPQPRRSSNLDFLKDMRSGKLSSATDSPYSSSPSTQTAYSIANFVWKDEESSERQPVHNEPVQPSRMQQIPGFYSQPLPRSAHPSNSHHEGPNGNLFSQQQPDFKMPFAVRPQPSQPQPLHNSGLTQPFPTSKQTFMNAPPPGVPFPHPIAAPQPRHSQPSPTPPPMLSPKASSVPSAAPFRSQMPAPQHLGVPNPGGSSSPLSPSNTTNNGGPSSSSSSSTSASQMSQIVCRYFQNGYCNRGDKCFYSHDLSNMDAPPPLPAPSPSKTTPTKKGTPSKPHPTPSNAKNQHPSPAPAPTPVAPIITPPAPTVVSTPVKSPAPPMASKPIFVETSQKVPPNPLDDDSPPMSPSKLASALNSESFYTNFENVIGKIYLVSKDQQGCRFLQKKLEEKDPKVIETIFSEVYQYVNELMTDPFGNYLCQKLLEHCNDDQKYLIVEKVSPDLVNISKNMHGTRAVQKMIEFLSTPSQVEIVKKALSNYVVQLIQDLNGNHVIQRCLNCLSPEDDQFIYDAVTSGNNCVAVATHRHGCCVLQRCIDHASEAQKVQLIQEIIKNALPLVQDPYGNYVVQYVLELPFPGLVESLAKSFLGNVAHLATQKFSSNVIEKCLGVVHHEIRKKMVDELLEDPSLMAMLQDPFANYVIQTALSVADSSQHLMLVEAIKPHLTQLRNTPYGKRIMSKITKETLASAKALDKKK